MEISGRPIARPFRQHRTHVADLLSEDRWMTLMARVAPSHLLHFAWIATPGVYWHSDG